MNAATVLVEMFKFKAHLVMIQRKNANLCHCRKTEIG